MAQIEKTVFISYRRKDISWALAVYENLTSPARKNEIYDVFFDYKSIGSGDFERIIISNIKARAHFLVILTPTALDRCNEPGDWLRREIETAIAEKRNIVPLFFNDFDFGDPSILKKLTGKLENLQKYNGMNVHADYFDDAMKRLRNMFLNVPLDTILFPLSDDVQKVVREQQFAANNARVQIIEERQFGSGTMLSGHVSDKSIVEFLLKQVQPSINKPLHQHEPSIGSTFYTFGDIEFVKVPKGEFVMGGGEYSNERPQQMEDLPDYYVSRFLVTNEQFDAYTQARGIKHPVSGWKKKRDHPVVNVSWHDAMAYCQWLNDLQIKELPPEFVLRLPTEPEWEKAARGPNGLNYPWGDDFDRNRCNTHEGGKKKTTPVGSYSPMGDSPYGCTDMVGNVSEWTHSLFEFYPYKLDVFHENEGSPGKRVIRGGSFTHDKKHAHATYRDAINPSVTRNDLGFRVVAAPSIPSGKVSLSDG